jgi:hypothetical protein
VPGHSWLKKWSLGENFFLILVILCREVIETLGREIESPSSCGKCISMRRKLFAESLLAEIFSANNFSAFSTVPLTGTPLFIRECTYALFLCFFLNFMRFY